MKKVLLSLVLFCAFIGANAQDFKPFKLGLGLGYAVPSGEGAKGGVLLYLEPAYRVNDQIAVGLRVESALMARGSSDALGNGEFTVSGNTSYTVNGQYYFSNGTFRPFVGLGLGLFGLASVSSDNVELAAAETKFGFYPRVGFDLGHFSLNLEYNIIPATEIDGSDTKVQNSYAGIKLGFFLFGGRKS